MTRTWTLETFYRTAKERGTAGRPRLSAWRAVFTLSDGKVAAEGGHTERVAVMRAAALALELEAKP